MNDKIVYLMRGLPSTGKSYTAKKLAGDRGVILETDEYFYTEVGDDPMKYDRTKGTMKNARQWNLKRFKKATQKDITPIVVDRGNSLSADSQAYARYAIEHGYEVVLKEPESEWWQEIRVLLKYKPKTTSILYEWADRLAKWNEATHGTTAARIRHWMDTWRHDLTVDDILTYQFKD